MNAHDIPDAELSGAADAGNRLAVVTLLHREFRALMKIDTVLREAIEQEEALRLDVCAGHFDEMLWKVQSALRAVVRELNRVPA